MISGLSCGKGGIGEALVKEFALRGLYPIATILPSEDDGHLVHANITCYRLDVTNEDSILQLKKQIFNLTDGNLGVLVNNA